MHRNDTSKFLLYIEPKEEEKLKSPMDDEVTHLMKVAFSDAKQGAANYSDIDEKEQFYEDGFMGEHMTDCGEESDNHDYLLKGGYITNSLCVFYVRWYRNSIHENDWNKLKDLGNLYGIDIELPEVFPYSPPSTKPRTYEEMLMDMESMMVEEMKKSVDEYIMKGLMNER